MDIGQLKGVGDKTKALLNKLDIYTVNDLISYYPRSYDRFLVPVSIKDAIIKKGVVAIEGIVIKNPEIVNLRSMSMISLFIKDEFDDTIKLVWYRAPYIKNLFRKGDRYVFRGVINCVRNQYILEHPTHFTKEEYISKTDNLWPIYSLTKGVTNNLISKLVKQAFSCALIEDKLDENIINEYELMPLKDAMYYMHFPQNTNEFLHARKRIVFDEFYNYLYKIRSVKKKKLRHKNQYLIGMNPECERFIEKLPYKLTDDQLKVIEEMNRDMSGATVMNRLIQGDVGSGKTIVALIAMLNTYFSGYQSAIMAPTEVLAKQHYETFCQLLKEYDCRILLLTGSMTAKEKRLAYEKIANNEADIIIGTHAIFQDKVEYANLALVITDEQHRFGVRQRDALADKGYDVHVIVMSATPIPRTLAQILYCDLDISVIGTVPKNRLPIKNCVVDTSYRAKAYRFINDEIKKGRQAYIICPLATSSENYEGENVVDYSQNIRDEFPTDVVIEYLHGKMKADEKNAIMERFADGKIDILVSTTVIEVGVNVPNSTVMMVENAQRFGLAALHQLRGRVGRGSEQSYCIFVSSDDKPHTKERLEILNKSNDGFYIANKDMEIRGPGDIFGIRQSGEIMFKIADIYNDAAILKMANEAVDRMENI